MMPTTLNSTLQASALSAAAFRNMAVFEGGYNVCINICKAADQFQSNNDMIVRELQHFAMQVPLNLSRSASYKQGKNYLRFLKCAFLSTKQLSTLLMLCHDMNYISADKFLTLNNNVSQFSSKLLRYIRFVEAKRKKNEN